MILQKELEKNTDERKIHKSLVWSQTTFIYMKVVIVNNFDEAPDERPVVRCKSQYYFRIETGFMSLIISKKKESMTY